MDWKQILSSADDDYLIGISNKGIVKRAYKDKEEVGEAAQVETDDEGLTVPVGGETVKISYPLGESKCSCPSRSICRHVVLAILVAKEQVAAQGNAEAAAGEPGTVEVQEQQETGIQQSLSEQTAALVSEAASQGTSIQQTTDTLGEEIRAYPLKSLVKAIGTKSLRSLADRMQRQEAPVIEKSSIVTVKLPEQEIVVKLLSPLVHSTCTCHKKELCKHKAEAILWCQWKEKVITAESLIGELEQVPEFDREQIQEATGQIKEYLEELLRMGLCRTSVEVVNALERLAILAHNAQLPRLENNLRAMADTYGRYLRRSASFVISDALGQLNKLYKLASKLLTADSNSEISRLAGEFRAEYRPVGDLELMGITLEHFVSQSGYEGDTVYFLEIQTGKWYTYTNARPTFYDGKRRGVYTAKTNSPWGLSVPVEGMVKMRFFLQGAKSDDTGRLSSSQDTRGELISGRELSPKLLKGWYYEDFGKAFAEQIAVEGETEAVLREKLVFLEAARVGAARFDKVKQVLHMPISDTSGRVVLLEVPYTKKDEATIRYLERMKEGGSACFVGRLYLKGSRLQMYPLEVFTGRQFPGLLKERTEVVPMAVPETEAQDAVLAVLKEAGSVLRDLYQVGFSTVQESVLQGLKDISETAEIYGLEYLAKQFTVLEEKLSMDRHRIKNESEDLQDNTFQRYMALVDYVTLGHKKIMYDKAKAYYKNEEE